LSVPPFHSKMRWVMHMRITISLRGHLIKYLDGEKQRALEVANPTTAAEALKTIGIDWQENKSFGFVAINGKRVMIDAPLKEGDELKAYPKISGG
jgi:sulfur carrier protein ThiS